MIDVDLEIENGVIVAYGHTISACALGQTLATVMAREIVDTSVAGFRQLRE
ncbi:MAG: hypothetical protein MO852_10100 [Candidatus Devosia euplotis]|nr:hypothetical protein [Candidatus Devosia euplotis]